MDNDKRAADSAPPTQPITPPLSLVTTLPDLQDSPSLLRSPHFSFNSRSCVFILTARCSVPHALLWTGQCSPRKSKSRTVKWAAFHSILIWQPGSLLVLNSYESSVKVPAVCIFCIPPSFTTLPGVTLSLRSLEENSSGFQHTLLRRCTLEPPLSYALPDFQRSEQQIMRHIRMMSLRGLRCLDSAGTFSSSRRPPAPH